MSFFNLFAMAKIQRIGHDHRALFWHLVLLVLLVDVSSGDAKQKQAATCTIHFGPPIFYRFRTPLTPPMGGEAKYFFGGVITDGPFRPQ